MPNKSFRNAIKEAIESEMRRDPTVFVVGEDVRGGHGGKNTEENQLEGFGGVLGVTKGLWTEFGSERVIDTPITESAIIGMAAGAAATGLRPVADLMFMDFYGVCHDMLYNQAAKFRYMFGGKAKAPMVVRGMIGAGFSAAAQHSQSPYNVFAAVPGLKVVVPSSPYDVKGLLIQAIRDDDPVVFCEHKMLYDIKGEVPDDAYTIPFGVANYTREGTDVTIIALGLMVHRANEVADKLAKDGISVEVVDPRTISPLDEEGILNALGLAGTQAAGLLESDHSGSMAKHLHAGKAAQAGVLSVLLAKKGFTGAHSIFEGKEGLFRAMGDLKDQESFFIH